MSHFVTCDPTRGTFTDIGGIPLVPTTPGVYALPPDDQCIAYAYPPYQFSEWIGVYTLNQTAGMLTVLNWWGGNYAQGLFTIPWDYAWGVNNSEGPYTVTPVEGDYPLGLVPNEEGTVASGNLIESGSHPITVQVTDSVGATATVSCDISSPEILLDCNNPPDAVIGVEYNHQLLASGGTSPYYFGLASGELPPGLRIDPITGIITGIPTNVT